MAFILCPLDNLTEPAIIGIGGKGLLGRGENKFWGILDFLAQNDRI